MASITEAVSTFTSASPAEKVSLAETRISRICTEAGTVSVSSSTLTRVPEPDTWVLMLPTVAFEDFTSPALVANCCFTRRRRYSVPAVPAAAAISRISSTVMILRRRFLFLALFSASNSASSFFVLSSIQVFLRISGLMRE